MSGFKFLNKNYGLLKENSNAGLMAYIEEKMLRIKKKTGDDELVARF